MNAKLEPLDARCPGPSVQDILAADRGVAPAQFAESPPTGLGTADLPVDVYFDREHFDREATHVWRRTWQMACRESQVSEPGQFVVYDILHDSIIVMRDEAGRLHAYFNSCLHRGTRLLDGCGKAARIRCRFHGFAWSTGGKLQHQSCPWDFASTETLQTLPEARIATWGGFVFVNPDAGAMPLEQYLGNLSAEFAHWPLEKRFVAAHVSKRMECNWKLVLEAFYETFHIIGLHPESLPFFGDINSQYDVWPDQPHVSRMINPSGFASPHLGGRRPQQSIVDAAAEFGLCAPGTQLAAGQTPRGLISDALRKRYREMAGVDLSHLADGEVIDVIEYSVFPNLIVFGGYGSPLAYRVRPIKDNPEACLFEVYLLLPYAGDQAPADAPLLHLPDDVLFASVEALGYYGKVLDQDAEMMPVVQRGLRASRKGAVTLSNYQESRIRHFRQTLSKYVRD